ncbi:fluoride efflux transporter FluC [Nocardioides sp. GXZ039]|uniref:fluoride efflux transporter FluC n=1 Tax=Nocardioides sp. GXZ039 TaxID=3136018 RepID=UPI0030F4A9D1
MILALLIAVAGGLGSALRYLADRAVAAVLGPASWGIVLVNVTGSFALGALTGLAARGALAEDPRLILGLGVCGGYTTFSTAMVDVLRLGLRDRRGAAVACLLGTFLGAVGAAALGFAVTA